MSDKRTFISHSRLAAKLTLLKHHQRGAFSVEFTLSFTFFLALFFLIVEISRILYISAAIDLAAAEAGKYSSVENSSIEYEKKFRSYLMNTSGLWPFLASDSALSIKSTYCADIEGIINHQCTGNSDKMPLALYYVTYHYTPFFFPLPNGQVTQALSRQVLHVQEYQRKNAINL